MVFTDLFRSFFNRRTDVFARFQIERQAISGTMSKFYVVRDRDTHEVLGLKVLDKEKTKAQEARLRGVKKPLEGDIAMQFDHPNVVKTYEHGITVQEEQYLLMEFIDGPGLNSLIIGQSEKLDGRRIDLIRQAAEAVEAVHEAGFIHHDICARNFVATKDVSTIKLIDFGLTVPATEEFKRPGNRTGTPAYMAPEVVRRRPTDHRIDIFSFGVTAYEICSFQRPWNSASKDGKAALAHDTVAPIPIEEYCPEIHPRLSEAIMSCIDRLPENRPQSMRELIKMIAGVDRDGVGA